MSTRTTETMVTFRRPFALTGIDGVQPPGTYRVLTEEEQIPGLSFVAFRRLSTTLHLPANPVPGQRREMIVVDARELATALEADAAVREHVLPSAEVCRETKTGG
jgi:hypothetical protein